MVGPPLRTTARSRPFSPAEVRRALRTSMVAWGFFGSAWMAMVGGAVYVTFVRTKLHASTSVYVLVMAVPFIGALGQLLGSYLTEVVRQRRRQCLVTLTCSRALWLVAAALPWVVPPSLPGVRIGLLLGLVLASATLSHISNPAGFSWFADIVPESIRARFLANRAAVSTVTVVTVSLYVSWVIQRHQSFATFTLIFAVAGVFGLIDIWLYALRVREPPMAPHEGPPWRMRNVWVIPSRNRPFRRYFLYVFCEAFMNGLVGPFWWLMALEFLKIGTFWANMYVMSLPMVFMAVALPFWGRVADRVPTRTLVYIGTLSALLGPLLWVLATPRGFHPFLLVSAVVGGACWAATQTADMSMMYSLTPRENRSAYTACLLLGGNLGLVISQLAGGQIARAFAPVHVRVGSLTLGNIHLLMLVSVLIILAHALFVIPRLPAHVEESADAPTAKTGDEVM